MRLDQFALPFRVEQVLKALRRVFLLKLSVVGERRDQNACRLVQPLGVVVAIFVMLHHLFRQLWRLPAFSLPDYAMRLVGGVDDLDGVDVGGIFLIDAREDALGT